MAGGTEGVFRPFRLLTYTADVVVWQVVDDHDIAVGKLGCENLFCIGEERCLVHRSVEQHRSAQAGKLQTADEGCRLPVAGRNGRPALLPAGSSPLQLGHLRGSGGLIDEMSLSGSRSIWWSNQAMRRPQKQRDEAARRQRSSFLKVMPRRSKNNQTLDEATRTLHYVQPVFDQAKDEGLILVKPRASPAKPRRSFA